VPNHLNTSKSILGIFLSIVLLVLAQGIASLIYLAPIPRLVSPVLFAALYILLSLWGAKFLCEKVFKLSLSECRITHFRLHLKWVVCSIVLPLSVSAILLCTPGKFILHDIPTNQAFVIVVIAIFATGIGVGVAEEVIFRGLMMTSFEKRWGKGVAILVPSILFGLLHGIGANLNLLEFLLLVIGGTSVGIMFSLIVYESGSVWNSAVVHGVWNMVIIGDILQIGQSPHQEAIMSYTLLSKSVLLTGGRFGIEVSLIAIFGYIGVIAVLLVSKKMKTKNH
jgi:uncharacterized protein